MRTVINGLMLAALTLAAGATFAWAQTNSKEIMARPAAELVELLKNPDASVFEKAKACQRLAVVGTADAVPALAALLPDEHLNLYARFGLEGIADPAADAALREAAGKLQGRQLAGVAGSLGQRRDAQAVGLLAGLLGNGDVGVASATAGALGQIGTAEAAAALSGALAKDSPGKTDIANGCIICADRLAQAGKKLEALSLYQAVDKAEVPTNIKLAALGGALRLQQANALDLLLAQIRNPDRAFFGVGLAASRDIAGAEVAAALAGELEKLPPERQALLLVALGDRADPAPLPVLLAAGKSASPEVRQAAIYALARHGDPSALAVLLDAALGDAEVAQTAQQTLKGLTAPAVDAAIVARLEGAQAAAKIVLLDLIGARQIGQASPAVLAALGDPDQQVRIAAMTAFARLATVENLDVLVAKALAEADEAETNAARAALRMAVLRMGDRDASALKLAGHIKEASDANRSLLLDLLGALSGTKSLEVVAACAKSENPALKDAATRVLGEWVNTDAAPVLLDIAKNDPDTKYQIRALRGYIRIARQLEIPWWTASNVGETKLSMFRTAMEAAKRNEEKVLALDILTRIPSGETLRLAASHVSDPALRDTAAGAAVNIAAKVVGGDPKAVVEAMQKVVDAGVEGDLANKAKQLLGQAQAASK